ncbi:hypothetical protein ACFCZ2_20400 [Streptomyces sp. NPDC056202]|uniref:hypothetical protein n=1 Tax=unclassified Streptomyces TaxID=2593676 RepID=UPI00093F17EB|nr:MULTISPECIES: hypothetical protein [unclassified Streptomyces]MCD2466964.1 hypothetical protein [Streptomyces sp. MBT42]OKJ50431.1 hypothetical protein AMK27_35905 [Streptomyces sp. CB02009]
MKKTPEAIEVAQEAVTELREALARAGIRLPSLGLDVVTLAADPPRPLVELGCCTVETARLLAAAVLPGEENRS